MKYLTLLLPIIFLNSCNSKSEKKTNEVSYLPKQSAEVSDEDYRKWTTLLNSTYGKIAENDENLNYADHINIATALKNLKVPKQEVLDQWTLAQQKDIEGTAEIFPLIYPSSINVEGYLSEVEYDALIEKFAIIMADEKEVKIDPVEYAIENNLDTGLVKRLAYLKAKDQEFRMSDMDKQELIDQHNIQIIDSMYNIYGKYIGNSLAGNEYKHTMWIVIQHSDIEHQEKYLSVIHDGVISNELPATPLKMLIDRIYKKKYGYQIFGSQSGGELGDDATIKKVKDEFGL